MKELKDIEKSIQKKYRKEIFSKFIKAVKEFNLIEENDKIAVCISGGKDSFLLAKCMQELVRHNKFNYEVKYIVMDPGYQKDKLEQIKATSHDIVSTYTMGGFYCICECLNPLCNCSVHIGVVRVF